MKLFHPDLAEFNTKVPASSRLVRDLSVHKPETILDLGCGQGNLINAALARWPDARAYCVDVTATYTHATASSESHDIVYTTVDVLSSDLDNQLRSCVCSADVILSNPPFMARRIDSYIATLLSVFGLSGVVDKKLAEYPTHYGFLAQSLRFLSEDGELAIILPESFVTGDKYRSARAAIMGRYRVRKVVQLPPGSFSKTEARCFVFYISAGVTDHPIELGQHATAHILRISPNQAERRCDYKYYAASSQLQNGSSEREAPTLLELGFHVVRGSVPGGQARARDDICHTTDIRPLSGMQPRYATFNPTSDPTTSDERHVRAAPGDILISRVGSRVVGDLCYVSAGYPLITDCVFRLRPTTQEATKHVDALVTSRMRAYLFQIARGTCARYLTKADILNIRPRALSHD